MATADRTMASIRVQAAAPPADPEEMDHQTFLTGLAHDLRQSLTAIRGTAQLVQRRVLSGIPQDKFLVSLAAIGAATDRLAAQIAELEDFASLAPDRVPPLDRAPVDLVALARASAQRHAATSDIHQFSVVADFPEGSAVVGQWDPRKLERALDNLLGNAVKFSPTGGNITINVSRETAASFAAAGATADTEVAALRVHDEGVGIPAADLPHVFECFRRAENVAGTIPGAGVGLAVVRQIIQQHGGSVQAESQPGGGSTFTLRLPLSHLERVIA